MVELVSCEQATPEANLAFDEALVRAVPALPLLRLWRNPRCVIIGRGQRPEREVDLAACARDELPVLRRGSGGGTVYQDLGNLNVTLVLPGTPDPLAALGELVSSLLGELGLRPERSARGVFVGGSKISGFAALRTRDAVLAHATLLCSTPAALVTRYLTPTPATPHPLDSHRSPVTSLAALGVGLPDPLPLLEHHLGPLTRRAPTERELAHQRRLIFTRYGQRAWHESGSQRKEESWTRAPVPTCTA